MRAVVAGAVGVALAVAIPAHAASDLAAKAQAIIDKGDIEGAKKKCEGWGAMETSADKNLREACAQAWLPEAEKAESVDGWQAFRKMWGDTSWATDALKKESNLALDALGYDAPESAYLDVYNRYPNTEAARLAYERAAETAVRKIKDDEAVLAVAKKYPEQVPNLLRTHLQAFVHVDVTADGFQNLRVEPPAFDPKTAKTSWVVQTPDGTATPWDQAATTELGVYGVPVDATKAVLSTSGDAPPFPLCYDPNAPQGAQIGLLVEAGGGRAFFPAPWAKGCGPDASPVFVTVASGKIVDVSAGPEHHVHLDAGDGPWQNIRALVPPSGDARLAGGLVVMPAGGGSIAQGLNGGDPWLQKDPAPNGVFVIPRLAAAWSPAGWSVAEGDAGAEVKGPEAGWKLPKGEHGSFVPLVQRYVGLWGQAPAVAQHPVAVARWDATAKGPAGSTPVTPAKGDPKEMTAALQAAGLDPKVVLVKTASLVDLDGDGNPELVADGATNGKRVVYVLQKSTGRISAWVARDVLATATRKLVAFSVDNHAVVAFVGSAKEPWEVVRADGAGFTLSSIAP